jgi:hypothetical protein
VGLLSKTANLPDSASSSLINWIKEPTVHLIQMEKLLSEFLHGTATNHPDLKELGQFLKQTKSTIDEMDSVKYAVSQYF